ncbi:diaminopimelate epimerase [Sphingomonas sp. NBWT7]|uniref:diaminopimelate epimerase n=1 Tax=Sphingomonas sp. NBWT7 TaxID=2596913 RepID=UPI001625D92B|nr:diaminopimelate epimerase [Sphingomonas sp. NBWT7]QNE32779.1 diaminopimelate epimerase [Sphingomonas sp. NBWT7]
MRLAITKCHGSGNDFALIDARALDLPDAGWAATARALTDRAGPVGADGILLLTAGDDRAAFGMRIFNADGSEPETCLNGLRCVARAGLEALGLTTATVRLKTSHVDVRRDPALAPGVYTVRETAGPATLDVAAWPLTGEGREIVDRPIAALSPDLRFTAVGIGNPHLIAFVDAIDEAALVRVGTVCEFAPAWLPNRANLSFVQVRGDDELYVRTFERGVGLTNACGSAMGASTYAAGLTGRLAFDRLVTVRNRGGLVRAIASADGMVTLSGNATFEWTGSVTVEDGVARDLAVTQRNADEVAAWAAVAAG